MSKYIDPRFKSLLETHIRSTLCQKRSKSSYDLSTDGSKGYNSGWIDALEFILNELPEIEIRVDRIVASRPPKQST